MNQPIQIEPVTDRKGIETLVTFPFELYRGDPYWVPPLIEERTAFFDPKKNPFFEHAECQLFLARRQGQLVGTIGAVINHNHNTFHQEKSGAFGFFEAVEDQEVADALLNSAETWAKDRGMTVMRGPLNFSTNEEVGTLIDGVDGSPMVMMTYNPRYYPRLFEAHGYAKAMDLYAYLFDLVPDLEAAPKKLFSVAEKAAQSKGIRVRSIDMRHFDREVEVIKAVYNQAWARNWGFVPMTDAEIEHLASSLKPMLDPALVLVAETADGQPAGVSLGLPDLHQALRWSGGGHMWPLGLPKFLWHKRRINQCRLLIMGMIEEHRGLGADAIFYVETARAAIARGYKWIETSWILESNTMMNRILERMGGRRYRTYRIYERAL